MCIYTQYIHTYTYIYICIYIYIYVLIVPYLIIEPFPLRKGLCRGPWGGRGYTGECRRTKREQSIEQRSGARALVEEGPGSQGAAQTKRRI